MFALGNVDPDFDDMATKRTESEYIYWQLKIL